MNNTSSKYIPESAAVLGCGRMLPGKEGWAQGHAHGRGYLNAFPGIELYGVDPNPENLSAFGKAFGLPETRLFASTEALYERITPSMVSVVTWPALHLAQVSEAVKAGVKMIACEKPVAADVSEIDSMLQVCESAEARLAIAHQRRHAFGFETMRRLFQEGAVGEAPVFLGRVGDKWDMLSWSVHWFDMANFFFGGPPKSILAGCEHNGNRRYQHAVEDSAVIYAEYENGEGVFLSGLGQTVGVQVVGSRGCLQMKDDVILHSGPHGVVSTPIPPDPFPGGSGEYVRMFQDLATAWASGADFRCDARHTSWATKMAFAAQESALQQRSVTLPSRVKYAPLEILQHPARMIDKSRLRILLLGDAHHFDAEIGLSGRDGLYDALVAMGHAVHSVPLETRYETGEDFSDADLLVIYHTKLTPGPNTELLVTNWVESGRPTLVTHCGVGAWIWKEYRMWTGRYWLWHHEDSEMASGHPTCSGFVEVDRPDLWSAPWVEAWLPRDEVYVNLAEASEVEDIAWIRIDGERLPFAWRTKAFPNVGVYLPGHRYDVWGLDVVRSGLKAMIDVVTAPGQIFGVC